MIRFSALWVLLLLPLSSFSYSFGYTPNVAINGLQWSMTPAYLGADGIGGMDVSGVTYKYTPIKNKEDDYIVTLENDKVGGGYVFQDVQNWSQREGGIEVRRTIALPYTPLAVFGAGRLKEEGTGSIENADVRYIYRFDPCFDPQSDPNCPGYKKPKPPPLPEIPDYDALQDDSVQLAQEETDKELLDKDEEAKDEDDEEEDNEQMESLLAASENALTIANEISQSVLLQAINQATNINSYYAVQIPGKIYRETVVLQDKDIVDNRRALRSLGQDKLMNQMVEEQYR